MIGRLTGTLIEKNPPAITVDVHGEASGRIIGFKAKSHAGLVDVDRVGYYDAREFWDPVYAPAGGLVLDPADFFILASREAVKVPPGFAATVMKLGDLVIARVGQEG